MMNDVRDIMITELPLCTPLTRVENIQKLMTEKGVHEILVVDTILEKHLLGTISDTDIMTKATIQNVDPNELNAEQCMRSRPLTVRTNTSLEECHRIMEYHNLESVTVIDDEGHICGVVNQNLPADKSLYDDIELRP